MLSNIETNTVTYELYRYDRQILQILQTRGRISNQELADAINLSPSPCLRRVRQLEENGLIDGYVALLNARKLGLNLMAFIQISMDKHTPVRFDAFEKIIADYAGVFDCHIVSALIGDYELRVVV